MAVLWAALSRMSFTELWNPDVILGTSALIVLYLILVGPGRRRGDWGPPMERRRIWYFLGAMALIYLAVGSPLDAISDNYLFSAHMTEHLILTMIVPPLLLAGTPAWFWRPLLRNRLTGWLLKNLTRPVVAIIFFNVAFSFVHFPSVYDLALRDETVHFLEHTLLVFAALCMWWPLMSPLPEVPALNEPMQMLYIFIDGIAMMVVFALITFAGKPLYPFYVHAPRMLGLTVIQDQKLGGIVMKLGSTVAYGIVLVDRFYGWVRRERMLQEFRLLPTPDSDGGEMEAGPSPLRVWMPRRLRPEQDPPKPRRT